MCQAHRGAPLAGVLLCGLAHQSLKGAPCVGSYSVVQCVRCLKASLSIVQLLMQACAEREAVVMAPPPTRDSAILPCFHGCLAFLQRYFPPQSPPSCPLGPSLCSQQQPSPWDCSTIPMLQLPATVPSRGPVSLSRVHMAPVRIICVIFIPFRLSHISCFTLSFKCFSSVPKNCPDGRDQTPAPFPPTHQGQVQFY